MVWALSFFLEYVTELMDLLFNEIVHDPAPFVSEMKQWLSLDPCAHSMSDLRRQMQLCPGSRSRHAH